MRVLLLAAIVATPILESAEVTIDVGADRSRIEARYVLAGLDGPLRFAAPADGTIELERVDLVPAGARSDYDPARGRLEVVLPASVDQAVVTLAYAVAATASRVPLFVPESPADPAGDAVILRVRGLGDDRRLARAFPRLEPAGGEAVARLGNLPSVVRLPPRSVLTVARAAEVAVLVLVVGASVGWLFFHRRRNPPLTPPLSKGEDQSSSSPGEEIPL